MILHLTDEEIDAEVERYRLEIAKHITNSHVREIMENSFKHGIIRTHLILQERASIQDVADHIKEMNK